MPSVPAMLIAVKSLLYLGNLFLLPSFRMAVLKWSSAHSRKSCWAMSWRTISCIRWKGKASPCWRRRRDSRSCARRRFTLWVLSRHSCSVLWCLVHVFAALVFSYLFICLEHTERGNTQPPQKAIDDYVYCYSFILPFTLFDPSLSFHCSADSFQFVSYSFRRLRVYGLREKWCGSTQPPREEIKCWFCVTPLPTGKRSKINIPQIHKISIQGCWKRRHRKCRRSFGRCENNVKIHSFWLTRGWTDKR